MIRGYLSIFSAKFRTLLQYRAAALAGCGTQLFWGVIRMMIFEGFYRSSSQIQPMSREDTITYVWLGQALLLLLPWGVNSDVRAAVHTGSVAYEMLRPQDVYTAWYLRDIAQRTAPVFLRCLPIFVIAALFFNLKSPPTFASGACWAAVTLTSLFLSCAFSNLVSVVMVYTLSADGIVRLMPAFVYTLSGMLIPIPLCPAWLQPILNFLPFRGMMDAPFRVYTGHIAPSQIGWVLLHQLIWTVALIVIGKSLLARSLKRMVIQGG